MQMTSGENRRLVVVSNRLPIVIGRGGGRVADCARLGRSGDGPGPGDETQPGPVDRLARVRRGSSPAGAVRRLRPGARATACRPVPLTEDEVEKYYRGFSNEYPLAPLPRPARQLPVQPGKLADLREVNRRFAEVVGEASGPDDFIWIHDYQLTLVGAHLREMGLGQSSRVFSSHSLPLS